MIKLKSICFIFSSFSRRVLMFFPASLVANRVSKIIPLWAIAFRKSFRTKIMSFSKNPSAFKFVGSFKSSETSSLIVLFEQAKNVPNSPSDKLSNAAQTGTSRPFS